MKILIADDDPQLVRALRITLTAHGHNVVAVTDGAAAVTVAERAQPDLVILDLGMPRLEGVQVLEALRSWYTKAIIVVSGRTEWRDKVDALDAGADDFVTKPFQINELLARLRALARRVATDTGRPIIQFGDVEVNLATKTVTRGGASVHLTPTEWRMLEVLAKRAESLVTHQMLLDELRQNVRLADRSYLRLYMKQLRRKLEPNPSQPRHLLTEQGLGYRLVVRDSVTDPSLRI